ncbi:hypothetical protein CHLRE_08g375084v5 [Chlamydomonas reinhardtii]|uniref:PWI domain-containing protein n=1 Tax=Chlamydomonas reinhardtii TaxID=3055 RepID=A0A2K3DHN2_CHLRE|nr:uncharacterized protein CHLRE_08g375084v5 [Chlamydomonas reinhardtii]PNW80034.1 hypothetical protein CHLRE_08g375084v5 [Chlamydomonas reinhardtii]
MPPGGMGFPGQPMPFGMRPPMLMGGMPGMQGPMPGGMPGGMGNLPGLRPPPGGPGPGMPLGGPGRPGMGGASALAKSVYVPPSIAEKSTTVYVGKIAGSVPDEVVRDLLDACGRVKSWKRQVDPDTKQPKGFGFCEFEDAEGVLRAMRLLNGLKLDGSELLLKCNAATQKYTEQYEAQKAAEKAERKARAAADKAAAEAAAAAGGEAPGAEGGGGGGGADGREEGEDGEADEDAAADNRVLEVVMSVVSEREEKTRGKLPPPPPLPGGGGSAAQAANDFLAQLGGAGGATPGSGGKGLGRERDREGERERERERDREREWAREAEAERRKDDERRRELDAKYEARLREWERYERERVAVRERERERRAAAEADWRRGARDDLELYDSEDEREPWERRPLGGTRKSMERRKRRLEEEEEDDIDRQREAREEERRAAARRAAAAEASAREVTPGPAASGVQETPAVPPHLLKAESRAPKEEPPKQEPEVDTNDPIYQAMLAAARAPVAPTPAQFPYPSVKSEPHGSARAGSESPGRGGSGGGGGVVSGSTGPAAPPPAGRVAFGSGRGGMRNTAALAAMFADEEETTHKRQLKPIRYSEEELAAVSDAPAGGPPGASGRPGGGAPPPADPKAALKAMMDTIPTARDGVFSYAIKWDHYNAATMGEKFRGWVAGKVEQLLGVPEPTLVDYVVKLLGNRTGPEQLHAELAPVLDNDTETFVIKLYRMVIYETEKAALGL